MKDTYESPTKDIRTLYSPCPKHPTAGMRREVVPVSQGNKHKTIHIMICRECGDTLQKLPQDI